MKSFFTKDARSRWQRNIEHFSLFSPRVSGCCCEMEGGYPDFQFYWGLKLVTSVVLVILFAKDRAGPCQSRIK